jgi:protein-disulfide isomerase
VTRGLILILGSALLLSQQAICQDGNVILAEIDGVPLTLAQFESERPSALFQARNTFYQAEKKAVQEYIDDLVLERQAKKENLSVSELLEKHVNSTIAKDPDDAALRVYFEGLDTKETFEEARPKIVEFIRQRRIAKAKAAYMQTLKSQSTITFELEAPRLQMTLKDNQVRGAADAAVTLVEFADYECPYCQQAQPILDRLEAEYKGKMAFVYKDYPLPMHSHAQKAAEAARCAGVQGKYWEYHDILLKKKGLEIADLKADAGELGLNTAAFDKCLDSGEQAAAVRASYDEATQKGIEGTPGFFVNGRFLNGMPTYEGMRQAIEEELKKHSSLQARNAEAGTANESAH